ncbi:MAG: PQQ-binding-like beta-propeller repeat protein [Opitutae bacterium]|nr:PQQ-binding-like beta-propeller repeat protein [Opitutae bacterium]
MRFPPLPALLALAVAAASAADSQPTSSAVPHPAPATPDPIEGRWTGTITAPQGTVEEFGLEFFRSKKGTLIFRLNSPAMFTYAHPFGIPVEADGAGRYRIEPNFAIDLTRAGDELTGTFGAGKLPLALHRGGEWSTKPPAPHHPPAPAPLWTHPLGAPTWAPPVVHGDAIYIGASDGKFHAVRASDGAALWTYAGTARIDGRAVVTDESIYFIDGKINLVALARADGTLRWSTPLHDEQLAGKPAPDNPTFNRRAAFPLWLDGVLYCGSSDGGLYAVDATTGKKLWRHDARAAIFSGIGRHGADLLTFGTMDGSVVILDRRTQKETFRAQTGGGVVTVPLVVGDKVIAGSRDYMLYGFNLADGSVAWRYSYWFSWIESTPVLRDGVLYVGASDYSRVTTLDPASGKEKWSTKVHGMNWGSPLVTDDAVFTGTVAQHMAGTVIAHRGSIAALDRRTGAFKWRLVAPEGVEGSFTGYAGTLALAGDKIIAAGFDGNLIALPAK